MTKFHAVLIDETGCEFGVTVEAENKEEAYKELAECYAESRVDQLESPEDTRERVARILRDAQHGLDYDDEGVPIYSNWYPDDDEGEEN